MAVEVTGCYDSEFVKRRVYIETTVVSYLTALPTRDLVRAAHQQLIVEWWSGRHGFELFISDAVLVEAGAGDPTAAARRLAALEGVPVLAATDDAQALASALIAAAAMPPKAAIDATHVGSSCGQRSRVPADLELRTYRERGDAPTYREGVSRGRLRAADHLHARRAASGGGTMTSDPIVDEVRVARDAFAKEYGYDLARIFEALREMARQDGGARVTLPPRRVSTSAAGQPDQPTVAADGSGTYDPGPRR